MAENKNYFELDSISAGASVVEIAQAIQRCGRVGALLVTDLTPAPFTSIEELFDRFTAQPTLGEIVNSAYTKNLVYKDAFAMGNGGPTVDQKRVLDISPERLQAIREAQAQAQQSSNLSDEDKENLSLSSQLGSALERALAWWASLEENNRQHILEALALAIGSDGCMVDVHSNYRMVDYYPHGKESSLVPPRCGEHRDFGAFTLVFSDKPGLELFVGGEWRAVAPLPSNSAVLLFGWCTELWSNGRIHATLHRVANKEEDVARRLSAVLFVAPKDVNTPLEPHVLPGEVRQYVSGVKVGQLRGNMARKWKRREGTLNSQERELEEEEIRERRLVTQDDVVRQLAGVYA